jgi:protein O-GlcNAc transferase
MHYYQKTISIDPNNADACNYLGGIFRNKGLFNEAVKYFRKAIEIYPGYADAYLNLGNALKDIGRLEEAVDNYRKALHLDPHFADAYLNLGIVLYEEGKRKEAITAFDMSLQNNPDYIKARWARCMSFLPMIFEAESDIRYSRDLYNSELLKLRQTISLKTRQDIENAAVAVGSLQPFYLACQGLNDRDLQQIYGDLVSKIMASAYPQFEKRPVMPHYSSNEPLRVGVVSGYFHRHSNWKIPIKGWIENLDKNRFSLFGYYTGTKKDGETSVARRQFHKFIEDIYSFEELCRLIQSDNLHILLYPEIGMCPTTVKLAGLRLAPIQCTSWGHCDTSGLPTIDYYISSDMMEPPDADDHYTEQLVRLPNLSIYYSPLDVPEVRIDFKTLGLRSESILFFCAHSFFTHLPQYDDVYPLIAQQVADCHFLFIRNNCNHLNKQFFSRINRAFKKYNLPAERHVVMLPYLDPGAYHAINSLSDIRLDTIGWSGCNSTFEAIACDLPIITLPGKLMRQRHSAAILTAMGITETIASSLNEYIELAVRLGRDPLLRKQISKKIAANKHLVYQDRACIIALEDFFEKAVRERPR